MSSTSSATKKAIRPHRKSRAGCSICKRRKVKCDEQRPCGNCTHFNVQCDLIPYYSPANNAPTSTSLNGRRGRGRPRKNWTVSGASSAPEPKKEASVFDASIQTPGFAATDNRVALVNVVETELLIHFITVTAASLAGSDPEMQKFWSGNVPRVGLDHTFVLHLIFATAAFHLAHLGKPGEGSGEDNNMDRKYRDAEAQPRGRQTVEDYLSLAQLHLTAGVSDFSRVLSHASSENCGALYLGAVLVSYCTFAAGPMSADDLLVCTASGSGSGVQDYDASQGACGAPVTKQMPFIHGLRLICASFSPDVLFAGLLAPLGYGGTGALMRQPVCVRDGSPRLDWEDALDNLQDFIATVQGKEADANPSTTVAVCLNALQALVLIYEANYGRRDALGQFAYDGPSDNQFVFGWLYRLDKGFMECIQAREPLALLVLSHYAVLLGHETARGSWFMEGWGQHIITRAGEFLGEEEGQNWMRWPTEQAELLDTKCKLLGRGSNTIATS